VKIGLIAGGYPPDVDGIGDYTFCLAKTLAEEPDVARPVTVYTRKGEHAQAQGVRPVAFFELSRPSTIRHVVPLIARDRPDWVVLQYNPFCWAARGFCPLLPGTLARLKKLPDAPKLAVMFHETTVPKWPWRLAMMYAWQRPILRSVVRHADSIFVSTKRWIPELASAGSRAPANLLPVGSNIPRSAMSKADARNRLGISADATVLGVFGGAHPSRLLEWITEAAREVSSAHQNVLLLHAGPEGDVLEKAASGLPFRSVGVLPALEVANTLRAADCLLSPFIDGVSTRRTSVVAALNNGVPVATTLRDWTDDFFLHVSPEVLLASSARDSGGFTKDFVQWLRSRPSHAEATVEKAHDEYFAWHRVSGRLIEVLRM